MRVPALALLALVACGAARPQARELEQHDDVDRAPRPYSRACVEACRGDMVCDTCCALDALIKWQEAPSEDPFCRASRGCTDAVGRFIYREAGQCGQR